MSRHPNPISTLLDGGRPLAGNSSTSATPPVARPLRELPTRSEPIARRWQLDCSDPCALPTTCRRWPAPPCAACLTPAGCCSTSVGHLPATSAPQPPSIQRRHTESQRLPPASATTHLTGCPPSWKTNSGAAALKQSRRSL